MASVPGIRPGHYDEPPASVGYALDAARAQVDEAFAIAQRLDDKVRNQVTLAIAFFAAAQAVTGWALGSNLPHAWMLATIGALVVAAIGVSVALSKSFGAWGLIDERGINHDRLRSIAEEAYKDDLAASAALVGLYTELLRTRRDGNAVRVARTKAAADFCSLAMALTTLELVISLAGRAHLFT